ncbi:RNA polymerase sigma factor [Nocardioides sp. B-3]|uniref:RNA polymerase sigma factor n=1 Tax=Nocardioides sp. B-3 TaxID=2895565 RepID=UPI0021533261|nr:sigma-70 family RNA polymerase sigma factor [Nocardioides sp. B-3]UUZ61236.1 sigma-70 family RNA polymerase sigma factor [Nocardioides sp. B-3]
MRALPEAQRHVIALHYPADLPVDQIADELGVPSGTVKSRLSRGREALALRLAYVEGASTMSERLLEAFREEAEWLTAAPSFELIEQRGRARRRRRRQAVLGMAAACVLAVTGIVATSAGEPRSEGPSGPVVPSVTPYPGPTMRTLAQGTYELAPGFGQSPTIVRFTVPPGWNAWEGPNRFEGMGPHTTDNEEVLSRGIDWYASVLVFEVDRITQRNCTSVDVSGHTPAQLARALARNPDLEVTSGPENTIRFGHHTVHLRLRANRAEPPCGWTFRTPGGLHRRRRR